MMNHDSYSDDYVRGIFGRVKTIAMVGASPRPDRPSNHVMAFLQRKGFRVIPVNPQAAGQIMRGERGPSEGWGRSRSLRISRTGRLALRW